MCACVGVCVDVCACVGVRTLVLMCLRFCWCVCARVDACVLAFSLPRSYQ